METTNTTAEPLVTIRISPVIERDFERRGVFPELRQKNAYRTINGATGIYLVSLKRAREILDDAKAQNRKRDLPRGLPVAYGSLAKNISTSLKQEARHGLLDDPGMAEVQRRQAAASACFQIGDSVLYFRGADEYGQKATIVNGYQMYQVISDDGPYITSDDERIRYQNGYVIWTKAAEHRFFVPAHTLTRDDCKPSHIRLVASPSVSGIAANYAYQRQGASA